ncbi:MAG: hypothetical protein QM655_14200 [Nocardioidaceae bacterium]
MSTGSIEEFSRKAQAAQARLQAIRGNGKAGGIQVEVDGEGRLLSVTSPDEDEILEAYRRAVAASRNLVCEAVEDLVNDPFAETVSSLVRASEQVRTADDSKRAEAIEAEWEEMRRDPLRRRH